jgi:SAM-dependent methyltransferase
MHTREAGTLARMKACWPAPERNKGPILEVLQRVLPASGTALEIGSGSGQHIAHFATHLLSWTWIPTDIDPDHLASISAYRDQHTGDNLLPPRKLDVRADDWAVEPLDAVYSANMIHIAPWSCCIGLLQGAARHLRSGGLLIVYGPFRIDGAHTAKSNASFDENLRRQNDQWGVRDLEEVVERAAIAGLTLVERVSMPANNLTAIFERDALLKS